MQPAGWAGTAYNPATESENRIHSDEVARQYGFRGGLVPGVTVYAYLVQPAIEAWGLEWLERGTADVALRRPLYDGGHFRVETSAADEARAFRATLSDDAAVLCAEGGVALPEKCEPAPARRGDAPVPAPEARPEATRAALERLRERGMGALHTEWRARGELDRYLLDLEAVPDLVRPDRAAWANPGFTLGLANWVLAANVRLGPWIHVESDVAHFAAIPPGTPLCVEGSVRDLFERRGHEFVDLDVAVFIEPDRPALTAGHRAIYRLRPPSA
jgi:hypothetical protein